MQLPTRSPSATGDRSVQVAVRLRRPLLVVLVATCAVFMASAQEAPIPYRYATTSANTDLPGGDIESVFDITFERCHAACLANGDCAAFTFDLRNGACFLKSETGEPETYLDAVSGVISEQSPEALELARDAQAQLTFLSDYDFELALSQAETMANTYGPEGETEAELLSTAPGQNPGQATFSTGAAVTLADSGQAWLAYAQARLDMAASAPSRSFDLFRRAATAATNAALRLPEPERADALLLLAWSLEGISRGEDALAAMRLAHRLVPGIATEELARLRERFGFRLLRHDVDAQTAAPRICVAFSSRLDATVDYDQYVQRAAPGLAIDVQGQQLCITGVRYGERYSITVRAGLPAEDGDTIATDIPLDVYVRDRQPYVRFPGRAYVLPAAGPRALPVETVNADHLELTLLHVIDRNLVATIREGNFLQALGVWEAERFEERMAESVWTGEAFLDSELNRTVTSLLPLAEVGDLEPGVYVLRAQVAGADPYDVAPAMQWFLVSDLGVTTLAGNDGVHVIVQRLSDGRPVPDITVSLLARSNRVLGEAATNEDGHAQFAAALALGTGNSAPAAVLVDAGDDFTVLSLEEPEFDLSDRGVAGRESPGPLDVFMTSDRGAYRQGETINLTVLVRDSRAAAVEGLPLTVRLIRPDGVEYSTGLDTSDRAGGYVLSLPLGTGVPLGVWRIEALVDTTAPPLAVRTVLVEDFVPERIDVDLSLDDLDPDSTASGLVDPNATPSLSLEAWHLFGAPAAGMTVTGEVVVTATATLPNWPGYQFGRFDQRVDAQLRTFSPGLVTDEQGQVSVPLPLDRLTLQARPYRVTVQATVLDGSSRPVERTISAPLKPTAPVLGIRPAFEGAVPENTEATFDVVIANPDGTAGTGNLIWQVDRVQTSYQWYSYSGRWYWEPITERQRIAEGAVQAQGDSANISVPVGWGRYELRVTQEGQPATSASTWFSAGWYAADTERESPDLLSVSLDAQAYAPGDVARLRIVPEEPGVALVTVLSDRVVHMSLVNVDGETTVELPVTDEWGAGAYVAASLIRPSDGPEHLPARSLGLAHADVDPGRRALEVTMTVPAEVRSGESLDVTLEVHGPGPDEADAAGPTDAAGPAGADLPNSTVYATVAVVDLGVLNLTGFNAPDPHEHYFGQRRLGVAIRDLYGRLIDARQGAMGEVRSGGDAEGDVSTGPVPTEDLVSLFSGPVELVDGLAELSFDLPTFNGAVRVMAVVWTASAVGQASEDVLVRDPVVVQGSLPRFLTPGDESRLRLELTHAQGPSGSMQLDARGHGLGNVPNTVELAEGGRAVIDIPLAPTETGDHTYTATLTTPDGVQITRELHLTVLHTDPEAVRTSRHQLAPGETFVVNDDALQGFRPGTARATVAAGVGGALDLPGQLLRLTGHAYGSTERIASGLQPYLRAGSVVSQMGLRTQAEMSEAVQQDVNRLLTRQSRTGGFGFWSASGGDTWLDAYVTETLLLAEARGADVPTTAIRMALDNLRNRLARAGTMQDGAEGYAYALYVLAQAGEAAIGDLRYYADVTPERFSTPLAAAHLGAALATYGEHSRAEGMFERAQGLALAEDETTGWRADYGSELRDVAAALTLMTEYASTVADRPRLATRAAALIGSNYLSSQESAWLLRAAVALGAEAEGLELDGRPLTGNALRLYEGQPFSLTNVGNETVTVTLTISGVPEAPPQAGGAGYRIERNLFTTDGQPADLSDVRAGDRLVVVLDVRPERGVQGGRLVIDDALPAGFEIDNPNLLRAGDVRALDWLDVYSFADHTEARADRFVAAVQWTSQQPLRLAYMVRAVSDGSFHYPAPLVQDTYRPSNRAVGQTGRVDVGQ